MLSIFNRNTLGQLLVILIAVAALWTGAFVHPASLPHGVHFSPLYDLIQRELAHLPRLATGIALTLIIIEGIWLNIILVDFKITKAHSLLPTLLYIIAMSWHLESQTLIPIVISNLFIIAAARQLLSNGATTLQTSNNFNTSFFIGLSVLFYLPSLAYFIPTIIVLLTYKMYSLRHFTVSLLGLAAPLIILFLYAFLSDKLEYYAILIGFDIKIFSSELEFSQLRHTLPNIFFLLILIATLFIQLGSMSDKMIHQRVNTNVLTLPLIASVIMAFYDNLFPVNTAFFAIPFVFLCEKMLTSDVKRKWILESVFDLLLICSLIC